MKYLPWLRGNLSGEWLLNEAYRFQTEVGLIAYRNQAGCLFNRGAESKVAREYPQLLAAVLVIFHNLKPQAHRIDCTPVNGYVTHCLKIQIAHTPI